MAWVNQQAFARLQRGIDDFPAQRDPGLAGAGDVLQQEALPPEKTRAERPLQRRCTMNPCPSRTSTGRIVLGTLGVKATPAVPPVDVNSVINSPPPDTARVIAPQRPDDPAVAVVVFI